MTTSATLEPTRTDGVDVHDRRAGAAALVAAGLSVASGATQLLHPQDTLAEIDPRTRVMLVGVAISLVAMGVLYARLSRSARSPWGARLAVPGLVLLAAGMLSSAVNGIDLAFFPLVAMVANALWFTGSVWLAVSLWRARRVPRAVAGLLVLLMPVTIVLSQVGGGILTGAYLAVVGWLLLRGQLERARR